MKLAKKHNKKLKKRTLDLGTLVNIAAPYLEVIEYSESEEDEQLFRKWYMKMLENMLRQEQEAEEKAWQEYFRTGKVSHLLKNSCEYFETHP